MKDSNYDKDKKYSTKKFSKNGQHIYVESRNIETEPNFYFGDESNNYVIPLTMFNFLIDNHDNCLNMISKVGGSVNNERYKISMAYVQSIALRYNFIPHTPSKYSQAAPEKRWVPQQQPPTFTLVIDWKEEEWPVNPSKRNRGGWVLRLRISSFRDETGIGHLSNNRDIAYASWNNQLEIENLFAMAFSTDKLKVFIALSDQEFASNIQHRETLWITQTLEKERYRTQLEEKRIKKSRRLYRRIAHKIYFSFLTQKRQEDMAESVKLATQRNHP